MEKIGSVPYYRSDYRKAEQEYWEHIPGWIAEDFGGQDELMGITDIGCGYGTLSVFARLLFPNTHVRCINHPSERRNLAEGLIDLLGLEYQCLDVELDDIPGYCLEKPDDIIILTEVLEHFNFYPVPTLKKIVDGLDFYGRIYISTPNAAEWGRLDKYASWKDMPKELDRNAAKDTQHKYQYMEEELRELLDMAGISIIRFEGGRHFNITGRRK